ncbi:unnamed protein product [Ectocarpus sp. 12 AP-2014]
MGWNVGGIRPILRQSLEGLLHRDQSFAQAFVGDRRTFERIVKSTFVAGGDLRSSRMERSAALHCIVLAFRLARIDDFTSEISLPVLIAGALSGVVQYPASRQVQRHQEQHGEEKRHTQNAAMPSPVTKQDGNNDGQQIEEASWTSTQLLSAQELASHALVHPMLEDIEDGAQSLLEALEVSSRVAGSSASPTPRAEEELEAHTAMSATSTITASSSFVTAAADGQARGDANVRQHGQRSEEGSRERTTKVAAVDSDFDDPTTCGTFALRRLCLCGLGFALLPPEPPATVAGRKRRQREAKTSRGNALTSGHRSTGGRGLGEGGERAKARSGAGSGAGLAGGAATLFAPAKRRGLKGMCMVGVEELHKARARSFGHAKRRARIAAAIEENKPPPAPKRSIGLNDRVNPTITERGSRSGRDSGGGSRERGGVGSRQESGDSDGVSPEAAGLSEGGEAKRGTSSGLVRGHRSNDSDRMTTTSNCCPSCGLAVLGHPLDTISSRHCGGGGGGGDPARHNQRQQPRAAAPAAGARAGEGTTALFKSAKPLGAAIDADCARNSAGFGTTGAISAGGVGSGGPSSASVRGKRMGGVGAAAVSQALGDAAVEVVAWQLGEAISRRRHDHDTFAEKLAEAHTRSKEAKELKLDRKVDLRRRLAAAANEAHQEIETIALRRRLLHGGPPSCRKHVTSGGVGGANAPGDSFPEDDKRGQDDLHVKETPCTTSAALGTDPPTANALSLARWNQHQKQDQEQRLQQLMVAMRDAVSRGVDESGRRPTLRRGSSSTGSRSTSSGTNSSARGSLSGRGSISGSGIYRDLARGVDAAHSAILSSMRSDGVDARAYLDERRAAFHGVASDEEEQRNAFLALQGNSCCESGGPDSTSVGGTTDWESTTGGGTGHSIAGGGGGQGAQQAESGGGRQSNGGGNEGGGGDDVSAITGATSAEGEQDDHSANTADGVAAAGLKARAVARDAEQLRLARARRAAKEERLEIEKREAMETERSARRRAKDRAEAARAERKAKTLARKELQRRREALDQQEEDTRVEKEKEQEERLLADAAERKRRAKLRRAREREKRKSVDMERARHEEEMEKIERWRQQERERKLESVQREQEAERVVEAARVSKLEASSREEERRQAEAEARKLSLRAEKEVAMARLKRGEFRYLRGRLVYHEAKGGLLMAINNCG